MRNENLGTAIWLLAPLIALVIFLVIVVLGYRLDIHIGWPLL